MADLFESNAREYYRRHAPLAERLRPSSLEQFFGQTQLIGEGRYLRRMLDTDRLRSLILWGPPGTGKTTLARIVAKNTGRHFVAMSAVSAGVADVKRVLHDAARRLAHEQRGTILFLDEIHRFNKAQQDALLRGVEEGTITLIGATTENPSFTVNGALLSRAQVLVLEPLDSDALGRILDRALSDERAGLGKAGLELAADGRAALLELAAGDARTALNFLELTALIAETSETRTLTAEMVVEAAGRRTLLYDRTGDEHYNVISAFIKSMRGSDPDAALYYLARMLEAGEDPEFVARRLVIFASEDVGNADPSALGLAGSAADAVRFIGMPEGFYPLAQCSIYLACAPKSNAVGTAYKRALDRAREHGALPVPLHLRNAPTKLSREVDGHNLPERIRGERFYEPTDRGVERRIARRLARLRELRTDTD